MTNPLTKGHSAPAPRSKRNPSRNWRYSFRLKTSLYTLILIILVLVLLALSLANRSALPKVSLEISRTPSNGSPADVGKGHDIALGKDAHLVDENVQRSFMEPDYALLSGVQPHEIDCDIPLEGPNKGVLVFLGIFSHAKARGRRDL